MYNEKQQQVVNAFLEMLQTRHKEEMARFGDPQDHDNREFLIPIRAIIDLYETDVNFTPAQVVEGLGEWASSLAHQEMKRVKKRSYDLSSASVTAG